ncbi:MAG: MotA/TolQ/ExbB proton channel family protein [Planctomycetota bacterium]
MHSHDSDLHALRDAADADRLRRLADLRSGLMPHSQPRWRSRSLLMIGGLVALGMLAARPVLAQGTTDAAAATEASAGIGLRAYLLPFQSLLAGDVITWVIVLCSVVAVTLITQATLRVRRGVILPETSIGEIEQLIAQRNFKGLIEFTEQDNSFVSESLQPALRKAPDFERMSEALDTGIAEQTASEFRRLEYINILANVGPLLGLLGTVVGIMAAFLKMQDAGGNAAVGSLAGGISVALGTTMLGLVLAIPCLVSYGILRARADKLTQEGALLAEDFLQMIRPDGKGAAASRGQARPATARQPAQAQTQAQPVPQQQPR